MEDTIVTEQLLHILILRIVAHCLKSTCFVDENKQLNSLISKFYEVDNIGLNKNTEDEVIMKRFESKLHFNGKRYMCELPVKEHCGTISDYHSTCIKRLSLLGVKLNKNC